MDFTYIPRQKKSWELDTRKLRHRYFVQLAPDQEHIVLGMVQQGTRPPTGQWLELGTIRQKLAERYFVQQTSFNTLVPGLLIQSDTPPGNTWKDVQTYRKFHYFDFGAGAYTVTDISSETTFVTSADFIDEVVTPALDELYPDRDPGTAIALELYYFMGDAFEVENDPTQMTLFSSGDQHLGYYLTGSGTYIDTFESTTTLPANLTIKPEAQDGYYSIVLGVLNDANQVEEYIILEDILNKFLPG